MRGKCSVLWSGALALALVGVAAAQPAAQSAPAPKVVTPVRPLADQARSFVEQAEARLLQLNTEAQRAQWVQENFITEDTETIAAQANERLIAAGVEYAKQAARFDGVPVAPDVGRKLLLLKLGLTLPAPSDPQKTAEVARLAAALDADYGKGKYCPPGGGACKTLDDLSRTMATSRDPKELLDAWVGWHSIAPPMKQDYARLAELANQGARELGFADVGAMWRSKYDMPPDQFAAELDRLWGQVEPLYKSLHCYVRKKLNQKYGDAVVPKTGPIPAHLLGNMWAQTWDNVYPLVAPKGADSGVDLTAALKKKNVNALGIVKYGENFFVSLGFKPLPQTFWERSLFVRPRDRDVVCHASAWDIDNVDDLRIKMCIEGSGEDFYTVHHELGHNFYQRAYDQQPFLFRDSANDGFHEGIGDTIALSITPRYLKELGLIDKEPDPSQDIGLLLQKALDKVAFLPFGLLIDQWRWKVYSGEVTPDHYNQAWWNLRLKYQGIAPPVKRTEADFDPGAKYHVPANVPYTRYFLADILQFQFHRALCKAAGQTGPLNRCSIYDNKAAGARLEKMLAMGLSKPWPEALAAVTGGETRMDATAILDYFAPLQKWLDEQNQGEKCGW